MLIHGLTLVYDVDSIYYGPAQDGINSTCARFPGPAGLTKLSNHLEGREWDRNKNAN